jgi:hypothetical protein
VPPLNLLRQAYEKDQTLLLWNLEFYDKDLFFATVAPFLASLSWHDGPLVSILSRRLWFFSSGRPYILQKPVLIRFANNLIASFNDLSDCSKILTADWSNLDITTLLLWKLHRDVKR